MIDGFFHPHDTSRSLPMALLRAREAVMSRFRPMLKAHGVTEQQWRVVRVLAEAKEIDVTQLADRTSILGPSLSRILRALEQQKIIRKQQDKKDGRIFWVQLTRQGEELIKTIQPDSIRIYAEIETLLGKHSIDRLLGLLAEVTGVLKVPDVPKLSGASEDHDED